MRPVDFWLMGPTEFDSAVEAHMVMHRVEGKYPTITNDERYVMAAKLVDDERDLARTLARKRWREKSKT